MRILAPGLSMEFLADLPTIQELISLVMPLATKSEAHKDVQSQDIKDGLREPERNEDDPRLEER